MSDVILPEYSTAAILPGHRCIGYWQNYYTSTTIPLASSVVGQYKIGFLTLGVRFFI